MTLTRSEDTQTEDEWEEEEEDLEPVGVVENQGDQENDDAEDGETEDPPENDPRAKEISRVSIFNLCFNEEPHEVRYSISC
jgi:hypothetical protein